MSRMLRSLWDQRKPFLWMSVSLVVCIGIAVAISVTRRGEGTAPPLWTVIQAKAPGRQVTPNSPTVAPVSGQKVTLPANELARIQGLDPTDLLKEITTQSTALSALKKKIVTEGKSALESGKIKLKEAVLRARGWQHEYATAKAHIDAFQQNQNLKRQNLKKHFPGLADSWPKLNAAQKSCASALEELNTLIMARSDGDPGKRSATTVPVNTSGDLRRLEESVARLWSTLARQSWLLRGTFGFCVLLTILLGALAIRLRTLSQALGQISRNSSDTVTMQTLMERLTQEMTAQGDGSSQPLLIAVRTVVAQEFAGRKAVQPTATGLTEYDICRLLTPSSKLHPKMTLAEASYQNLISQLQTPHGLRQLDALLNTVFVGEGFTTPGAVQAETGRHIIATVADLRQETTDAIEAKSVALMRDMSHLSAEQVATALHIALRNTALLQSLVIRQQQEGDMTNRMWAYLHRFENFGRRLTGNALYREIERISEEGAGNEQQTSAVKGRLTQVGSELQRCVEQLKNCLLTAPETSPLEDWIGRSPGSESISPPVGQQPSATSFVIDQVLQDIEAYSTGRKTTSYRFEREVRDLRVHLRDTASSISGVLNIVFRGTCVPNTAHSEAWNHLKRHLIDICERAGIEVYEPVVGEFADEDLQVVQSLVSSSQPPRTIVEVTSLGVRVDDMLIKAEVEVAA